MRLERPSLVAPNLAGRLERCVVTSDLLRGNPLGDPATRELPVYVPPDRDARRLPCLWLLAGFGSRGAKYAEAGTFQPGLVEAYDRAVAAGRAAPAVLAMPDAFTALGGSQYVDSPATGPYASHIAKELLPLIEEHLGCRVHGVLGKSSGGFGALHLVRSLPGRFAAAASISGDMGFDLCHATRFPDALRALARHDCDVERFLAAFRERPSLGGDDHAALDVLAMTACYAPDAEQPRRYRLPFRTDTCELVPEVWRRWLAFDPVEIAAEAADAWRRLRLLHLECGVADEYHLHLGLRRFVRRLRELGVPHVHEEHPGGHRGTDDRMLLAITRLAAALGDQP
jgi:S-formylglutathione hydrolase FrmB